MIRADVRDMPRSAPQPRPIAPRPTDSGTISIPNPRAVHTPIRKERKMPDTSGLQSLLKDALGGVMGNKPIPRPASSHVQPVETQEPVAPKPTMSLNALKQGGSNSQFVIPSKEAQPERQSMLQDAISLAMGESKVVEEKKDVVSDEEAKKQEMQKEAEIKAQQERQENERKIKEEEDRRMQERIEREKEEAQKAEELRKKLEHEAELEKKRLAMEEAARLKALEEVQAKIERDRIEAERERDRLKEELRQQELRAREIQEAKKKEEEAVRLKEKQAQEKREAEEREKEQAELRAKEEALEKAEELREAPPVVKKTKEIPEDLLKQILE